jgi:dTDP-4-amino-4,6-dideoxygalactose transaminase
MRVTDLPASSLALPPIYLTGHRGLTASAKLRKSQAERFSKRFQPDARVSWLYFASVCCTPPDHNAKGIASLREHAIQRPYLVAHAELARPTGMPVTEGSCSRIVSLPAHDDMAHVLVLAAAQQAGSR